MIELRLSKVLVITWMAVSLVTMVQAQGAKEVFNYDESKVGFYELPDLFKTKKGELIGDVGSWEKLRRPEILTLFDKHIYGQVPTDFDKIDFSVRNEDLQAMDGRAHLKEVEIKIIRRGKSALVNLTLFIPNGNKKPVPGFLLIHNLDKRNISTSRDTISESWPAEKVIEAGYAIASLRLKESTPDDEVKYKDGVLRLYPERQLMDEGMKTIGSWAWAASRIMDYFEQDAQIDERRIAIVGHSRSGKTALWTAANDKRFAMAIANNSGNTGAALSRRNFGETVNRINTRFPHWFNNNYKKYNNNEKNLPIDQHMLIALIAPRPVYITSASEDLWSDPLGMFLAEKEAEKVYQLYGLKSNLPSQHPAVNSPIYKSVLGYHMRQGKHKLTEYDWLQFIKFADYNFKKN